MRTLCSAAVLSVVFCVYPTFAEETTVHVLANDRVTEVATLADPTDLWIAGTDLDAATGFTLKPEGACLDDICIPIRQDADSDQYVNRDGKGWVNVTRLADKLGQAYAVDREEGVWSLGPIPAVRESTLESAVAPEFELADRNGNVVKLSDYRGKKVLLVTWASW